jgi:hypothetical protein
MKNALIIIVIATKFLFAQTGNLTGKVTDGNNPVPSVNILVLNSGIGTVTNEEGKYLLKGIPEGKQVIRYSSVGYKTVTKEVNIYPGKTIEINVELNVTIIEVGEVNVTGIRKQEQRDTRTSLIDLNPRSAKVLPGAGEDVLRTLQSLPGVLAPNDFSSQLVIRGSGPDQNLIIMDDVEIFNPYRLYGVISMFNPDAVENVNLITGGFPARYGDRLSAVLDVTNKEGNDTKNLSGSLNASIIDANLVLEGKNPFSLKGSWMFNSRRTYYDLIIEPFVKNAGLVDQNVNFPNFYDFQTKIAIGPYNGNKILINGIYSRDGVDIVSAKQRKTADSIGVSNVTLNNVASIAWHFTPNTKFLNKVVGSYYTNNGIADFNSEFLDPSLNRENFKNILADTLAPYLLNFKFNTDFTFQKYALDDYITYLWGDNIFEAGAGVDFLKTIIDFQFDIDPELRAFFSSNPQFRAVLSNLKDIRNDKRYHAFMQNNFSISKKFYFQPGVRFDYYDILRKAYLAPRISMSYALDDLTTIRAVWGIYYQSPGYEKLRDENVLYDLSDVYAKNLKAEEATHYIIGIERWLNSEWSLKLEGYYKDFNNLIVQKVVPGSIYRTSPIPGKDLRYLDGWTQPVTVQGDSLTQIPVNNADGNAYGVELFLAKKNLSPDDRLSGWISYSYSVADRNENNVTLPFRFDQRHTVNIVLDYQLNSWLNLGLRWQYGSGFPISQPAGVKPRIILVDSNGDGIPDTPEVATRKPFFGTGNGEVIYDVDYNNQRLNARKPAYHRLDVRFTAVTNFWNLDWAFYLDVINAYNRSNVIGYDYYINNDLTLGRDASTMFPIIPTLGFSVKF